MQSTCQPLTPVYRGLGKRHSVTKDTLLVVSRQAAATSCRWPPYFTLCAMSQVVQAPTRCLQVLFACPGLTSWAIIGRPFRGWCLAARSAFRQEFPDHQVDQELSVSFRHVVGEKSIPVTCYTGSVCGATSSILPCCSRNTRWQRRANAKLWVAMREVN